jgi:hypothetical protein
MDRTKEEIEFEKNKEECTFKPICDRLKLDQSNGNLGARKLSEDRYVQKDIERMKKAREEKERIKKLTERGIFL